MSYFGEAFEKAATLRKLKVSAEPKKTGTSLRNIVKGVEGATLFVAVGLCCARNLRACRFTKAIFINLVQWLLKLIFIITFYLKDGPI